MDSYNQITSSSDDQINFSAWNHPPGIDNFLKIVDRIAQSEIPGNTNLIILDAAFSGSISTSQKIHIGHDLEIALIQKLSNPTIHLSTDFTVHAPSEIEHTTKHTLNPEQGVQASQIAIGLLLGVPIKQMVDLLSQKFSRRTFMKLSSIGALNYRLIGLCTGVGKAVFDSEIKRLANNIALQEFYELAEAINNSDMTQFRLILKEKQHLIFLQELY